MRAGPNITPPPDSSQVKATNNVLILHSHPKLHSKLLALVTAEAPVGDDSCKCSSGHDWTRGSDGTEES